MSWKHSGKLISGPPTASNEAGPSRLLDRIRPNSSGLNAFHRERHLASRYGDAVRLDRENRRSEWDVLKENHRDDEELADVSWEERLARAYESKLFKEFALVDLKHYKSKRFALRWRTAPEVVEGIGEDTCGSLRCRHHEQTTSADAAWSGDEDSERRGLEMPRLRPFELPFVYQEAGERKEALVKVKLCPKCEGKLKWKPRAERSGLDEGEDQISPRNGEERRNKRHKENKDDWKRDRKAARSRDEARYDRRDRGSISPERVRSRSPSADRDTRKQVRYKDK